MKWICVVFLGFLVSCTSTSTSESEHFAGSNVFPTTLPLEKKATGVSTESLTLGLPYSVSSNFHTNNGGGGGYFEVATPSDLSWVIYEYALGEYQPATLYFYVRDAKYYVLLANYTEQRWDVVETVEAQDSQFAIEHIVTVPNWPDYYSPEGAVYVAVLSQEDGFLEAINLEDSRDAASRRFGLLNAAQDIYYGVTDKYFGSLGSGNWFIDDHPYLMGVTAPPYDPFTGTMSMTLNSHGYPPKAETAVGFTLVDGTSGLFERTTGEPDTEVHEAQTLKTLFCQRILHTVFDAQQTYLEWNFEYGSAADLNSPPAPQPHYLDDKYVHGYFGSGIELAIDSSNDGFVATVTCDGSAFTIDQTGVIHQQ
jgi:hypothetical protein